MDELYIESFSKPEKVIQLTTEIKHVAVVEDNHIEIYEFNNQMLFYLDQLEKDITNEYKDFTDFRFIFDKIKKKLKAKNVDGILDLLVDLEELLDIGLPTIILKKSLEASNHGM